MTACCCCSIAGRDAAGIATAHGAARFNMHKAQRHGARRIPHARHALAARDLGIAHVRYPTAGSALDSEEAQPFYVNAPFGVALAHNGNLTNSAAAAPKRCPAPIAGTSTRDSRLGGAAQRPGDQVQRARRAWACR
jgi:glutamine phosphoribosylpyrophosphate amidotransferase